MKSYKLRICIYIIAFVVTAIITYIFKISDIIYHSENGGMNSAGLPVVYMTTEKGTEYNYLNGYVSDVNYADMREVVSPISNDRVVNFGIKNYGMKINEINYEIRDLSGENLIERNSTNDFTISNNETKTSIKLKNLLKNGEEYMLKISLSSDKYEKVSYYTRIVIMDNANLDQKIDYVKWFTTNTLDDEKIQQIIPKLEPNKTADNTNLGHVNIHSKLSQVGFGDLAVGLKSEIHPEINEINGNVASITLNYQLTSTNNKSVFVYDMTDFFRINQVDDKVTYVYAFDRFMNQKFDYTSGLAATGNIYLGISATDSVELDNNAAGTVTTFVRDGNLWSYSSINDRFTKVFSFEESDSDGLRENNKNHGIKVIDIDKKGNIKYIVYGYMNRGYHEGKTGISAFYYSANDNTSEELVFIPTTESYKITKESVDKLIYINDQNILYFYQNRSIYYLNYETKECMLVDSGILPDSCMMSDNKTLVYQTGNDSSNCDTIKVIDLPTGDMQYINCKDSERIKVLGFIDNNIVYGICDASTIEENIFPMKAIYIVNNKLEEVRKYQSQNIYFTGAEFYEAKIIINRVMKDESGNYMAIDDDQLLSNEESNKKKAVTKVVADEERQKELYIVPLSKGASKTNYQAAKYVYTSDNTVYINNEYDIYANYYYVYTYGDLYDIDTNLAACIKCADETGGVVTDHRGNLIWNRYKDKVYNFSVPEDLIKQADDTYEAAMSALKTMAKGSNTYDLSGCSVEEIEYFINKDYPVVCRMETNNYVLIYGYSESTIFYVDFANGVKDNCSVKELSRILTANSYIYTIGK